MAGNIGRFHGFLCRRRLGHIGYKYIDIKKKKCPLRNWFCLPGGVFCGARKFDYIFYRAKKSSAVRYCRPYSWWAARCAACSKDGWKSADKENVYSNWGSCNYYKLYDTLEGDCAINGRIAILLILAPV